jgi:hypothetical protein
LILIDAYLVDCFSCLADCGPELAYCLASILLFFWNVGMGVLAENMYNLAESRHNQCPTTQWNFCPWPVGWLGVMGFSLYAWTIVTNTQPNCPYKIQRK